MAEILLPTGGKLQYDYVSTLAGLPSGNSQFFEYQGQGNLINNIDRVVSERRTFPDGVNLEGSTTYSFGPQTFNGTSYPCAEVKSYQGPSATGALLMRQRHFFLVPSRYLTGNIGGGAFGTGNSLWSTGVEWRTETLDSSDNVITASEQDWAQRASVSWTTGYTQEQPANDNRASQTRNYLNTGSFAKTEIFYDNFNNARANNVIETKEYDFDLTLKRRTVTSYLMTNPDNGNINYSTDDIFLLRLPTQQSVYEGSTEKARTVYKYDKYTNDGNNATLTDYGPSVTAHDTAYGTGKTTRGNPTAIGHWLNTNGSTLFTYSRYDTLGNVVSVKDPRNNVATISFADNFGNGNNPDSGAAGTYGPTYALPTLATSPPPNAGEAQHTAKSQYDFSTGILTGFKDRNNVITKTEYNDPFNRPTRIINAKGVTGVETQTATYYAPQSIHGITLDKNDVMTVKDRDASGDALLRGWTLTDGLGRTIESWTRHPQGDVKVTTIHDALGRVKQTSNPYRSSETPIYTTTTYDLAGRVTARTTPDGAMVSTVYDGARVMVTDQAQKRRISETDGLGRLLKVWEIRSSDFDTVSITFPQNGGTTYYGYLTQYTYDLLDNLTNVSQGAQTRTFAYDSLERLTSANNPESGLTSYLYDENGSLLEKTDARTAKTSFTYDALNRVKSKTYSGTTSEGINAANATPQVYYKYDNQAFPSGAPPSFNRGSATGRLVSVTYGVSTSSAGSYFGYEELGRVVRKTQQINGNNYAITAIYNRASAMISENYPSGRAVNYAYDIAGRLSGFSGTLGDNTPRTYANITQYNAAGQMERESYGVLPNGTPNGMSIPLYLKLLYNKRHQLADLRLGSVNDAGDFNRGWMQFYYGPIGAGIQNPLIDEPTNNGNLVRQWGFVPKQGGGVVTTQLDDYTYDPLNRLATFTEGQINESGTFVPNVVTQNFAYDRFGNRRVTSATGGVSSYNPTYNTANNRINGLGYDSEGNITSDPMTGGTMTYDAENRLLMATNGGGCNYTYDGEGKRVKRITAGGQERWYVYGIGGELLAEYLASVPTTVKKEYGYRDRQLLVTADSVSTANLAVGKPATQSSTDWGGVASRAVDGNTSGNWADNSVSHTAAEIQPWWQLDLSSVQQIGLVKLWNRTDCCSEQLNNFYVLVSDAPFSSTNLATAMSQAGVSSYYVAGPVGAGTEIGVDRSGRYVRVQLAGDGLGVLHMAEVEIRGGQGIQWLVVDHLGSTRMVIDQTGSLSGIERLDYAPFGEELTAGIRTTGVYGYVGSNTRQKFDGYERDSETGLDFAQARYFASVQGRFTSPDQPFADQDEEDPQSWNLYSFVVNNPLKYDDPLGLWKRIKTDDGTIIFEAEKGDTLSGLAEILNVPVKSLIGASVEIRCKWVSSSMLLTTEIINKRPHGYQRSLLRLN